MTKKQTKEIFDKYNPSDKVVRCPNGKAKLKKILDKYAQAAVNLYGIISRDEFVKIFNEFNEEKTTTDEVFILLLPNVIKGEKWYGFYKDYIVHYCILERFEYADYLEANQAGKPRYIPSKEEFINYEFEWYKFGYYWDRLLEFMLDSFTDKHGIVEAYEDIKVLSLYPREVTQIGVILKKYNLILNDQDQAQMFFDKVMVAMNNTRIWENKGHTPEELLEIEQAALPKEPIVKTIKKIGVNELCPCGSGKKYKKCCKVKEESGMAKLTFNECKLFYETWYKLLNYINEKNKIYNYIIKPIYPSNYDESQLHVLRNILWDDPKLIDEFIKHEKTLSIEEITLLESWGKNYIKGEFILIRYESEYAVLMRAEKNISVLYGVKGMTTSISEAMQHQLPAMIETVLLPFKDKIIYDSFIGLHSISFGSGANNIFIEEYEKIKNNLGITTILNNN